MGLRAASPRAESVTRTRHAYQQSASSDPTLELLKIDCPALSCTWFNEPAVVLLCRMWQEKSCACPRACVSSWNPVQAATIRLLLLSSREKLMRPWIKLLNLLIFRKQFFSQDFSTNCLHATWRCRPSRACCTCYRNRAGSNPQAARTCDTHATHMRHTCDTHDVPHNASHYRATPTSTTDVTPKEDATDPIRTPLMKRKKGLS